ncbi:OPRK protein, partial [Polypterus senegalus]
MGDHEVAGKGSVVLPPDIYGKVRRFKSLESWCFLSCYMVCETWTLSSDLRRRLDSFGTTECALQFPEPYMYWDTLMKICVFIFAFVVPVLIITVCYTLMILRLKSVRLLSGSREKDRNLRRITRLVLVVVAVFIVCWTPIHIFILVKALANVPETTSLMAGYFFCVALGYTNSSLNPILYAFLDENFKRCFKDFCFPPKLKIERQGASKVRSTIHHPEENVDGTSKPV